MNKRILDALPALQRFALRLTRDQTRAGDLVNDTVLKILERQHTYIDQGKFSSWATRIMFTTFLDQKKRSRRLVGGQAGEITLQRAEAPDRADAGHDARLVNAAMATLRPDQREIIVLIDIHGHTYREIAEFMKIPVGTVRSRISRARDALAAALYNRRYPGKFPARRA